MTGKKEKTTEALTEEAMTENKEALLHYTRPDDSGLFVCGLPTTNGNSALTVYEVTCWGCEIGLSSS